MRKKLVIIGAGSAMFTQGLVIDLMNHPCGCKWHLSLVDIDAQALDSIAKLIGKMLVAKNADVELSFSTNRRDEFSGADYVVSTIGVGGRRAWEQDVLIPRKYGIYQPVGDTAMPGGISRAMRMIPAMLEIARDVQRLCPDAKFFNYSNPMTVICRALRKCAGAPVVGLCHGVNNTEAYLANFAGVQRDKLTAKAVGINHFTFLYDIRDQGADIRPLLKKKLEAIKAGGIDYANIGVMFPEMGQEAPKLGEPFAWELFEAFGAYPAPGDRHITEFMAERFAGGSYYGKTLGMDAYTFEGVIEYGDRIYDDMTRLGQSTEPLPEDFFNKVSGEHEQLMDIIDSIEHDRRRFFSVNLPNEGAVPNLPRQAVLELPGIATASGIKPMLIDDFPDALAAMIQKHLAIVEMTVEAALQGSKRLVEEAILMGGYISDRSAVTRMVDELITVQMRYLPQF